ncbi:hypothetical protein [Corallococcus sp. EGB]|uniref:DUF6929 family protein n=1 Tax=Corallococcus sp. EGB TaxID=1521117 RepID=UPI001CBBA325|nr:hypothetical protein [Corallococcus sp. EGB]
MIPTTRQRTLTLAAPEAPHICAASGLVRAGDWLYVVADDALHLAVFPVTGDAPGHTVRLSPDGPAARWALCRLGPSASFAHGALLALPSGATPALRRALVLPLSADGTLAGEPRAVDCASLYVQLERELAALDVEGAAVAGKRLRLLNRGNGAGGVDALVDLDLDRVLGSLDAGVLGPEAVRTVRRWELGEAHGVRLSFTDAAPLPDGRVVFTATAEATRDRVATGPVTGSAVGVLAPDGTPVYLDAVDAPVKLTGVDARVEKGRVHVLLVADAGDPSVPAPLLDAALPVPG